jgi:hypothetical protein
MRLRRKIVTASVSVVCGLALAACGQQVVAHVSAADTVHSALSGVFNSPTTRFDVTAQNLPGTASLADGSFSVVITTSKGSSATSWPTEISVYHESADLADILTAGGAFYLRVDVKDIAAFTGPGAYSTISSEISQIAARPGLAFLGDILAGKWVGISKSTYLALEKQILKKDIASEQQLLNQLPSEKGMLSELKSLAKLGPNSPKVKELRLEVTSSLSQSLLTWLSIRQKADGEYSLNLPVRSFVGSVVDKLAKPVESFLDQPAVPQSEISKALKEIPAGLTVNANLWISNGSLTKIQAFIPTTSAYLEIGISHPSSPVTAPSGATMLTAAQLEGLVGDLYSPKLPSSLPMIPASPSVSGIQTGTSSSPA